MSVQIDRIHYKTKSRAKRREFSPVSHTSEKEYYTGLESAEPAVKAISLINKRIQDLMLVCEAQIRSDGSMVSAATIGMLSTSREDSITDIATRAWTNPRRQTYSSTV